MLAVTAQADPVPVTAEPLASLARYPERSAPATVLAVNTPTLAAELVARIETIPVLPGDAVEAGATLVTLDCRDYRRAVQLAEAQRDALVASVTLAEQKLARAEALAEKRMAPEELLDERASDLTRLQAQRRVEDVRLAMSRADVGRCRVTAPFRALVTERHASEGDLAQPGTPLVSLSDLSRVEVVAEVYAPDAEDLGGDVSYRLLTNEGEVPLSLITAVPAINPETRTRVLRFALTEGAGSALPGSAGRVSWRDPRMHVPARYVVQRDGQPGVFVVAGERVRFAPLPGAETGRDAPIALPPETAIVIAGQLGLNDGDSVTVRPAPAP